MRNHSVSNQVVVEAEIFPRILHCLKDWPGRTVAGPICPKHFFGLIIRHPLSFEYSLMFNPSGTLRTLSSPFRRGAPRAHWPELALAEAQFKISTRRNSIPTPGDLFHSFYTLFTIADLKSLRSTNFYHSSDTNDFSYSLRTGTVEIITPQKEIINPLGVFGCCHADAINQHCIALDKKIFGLFSVLSTTWKKNLNNFASLFQTVGHEPLGLFTFMDPLHSLRAAVCQPGYWRVREEERGHLHPGDCTLGVPKSRDNRRWGYSWHLPFERWDACS